MGRKVYIADRVPVPIARREVALDYQDAPKGIGKTVEEMRALGVLKSLTKVCAFRQRHGHAIGNLAGWVAVAADIAAALKVDVERRNVEAMAVRIGLTLDDDLIDTAWRRVAAARRADPKWRLMSGETIGKHVELTADERDVLKITNIGSADESPDERRKRRARESARQKRAEAGIPPRTKLAAEKPWQTMGISKTQYYQKGYHRELKMSGSISIGKAYVQSRDEAEKPGKPGTANFQSAPKCLRSVPKRGHSEKAHVHSQNAAAEAPKRTPAQPKPTSRRSAR